MIAVVTSTIKPEKKNGNQTSFYSFNERLEQTKFTLASLQKYNFTSIFLIDNSPDLDQLTLQELLLEYPTVQIHHIQQYQFNNKGLNELMMLLYIIKFIPLNQIIFKLSARYYPTTSFKKPDFFDFAVKGYEYKKQTGTISTRGYWVKNSEVLHKFLLSCLSETFTYAEKIVGIRSLYNKLAKFLFDKKVAPLNISIEFAAANVLKNESYNVTLLPDINIEGFIAGSAHQEKITE